MRRHHAGLLTGAAILLAVPMPVEAQAVAPGTLRHADITFAMRATKVNDFVGRVDSVEARFTGTTLATVTGLVEFRVRNMHTGIGLRDTHMRHALDSDSFPTIRFELVGLDPGVTRGDTTTTVFQGHLTIHGVTHTIRATGSVVRHSAETDIIASFPINMREYGIDPPSRFFGAIKVDPVTEIGVRLTFGG